MAVEVEYHCYNIQPFSKVLADYFIPMLVYQSSVKGSPGGSSSFFFIKDTKDTLAANGVTNSMLQASVSLCEIPQLTNSAGLYVNLAAFSKE